MIKYMLFIYVFKMVSRDIFPRKPIIRNDAALRHVNVIPMRII
jgi:hypothetical protein